MMRVFNSTAKYVDQGGNKRPGAFACYIEPWHADIFGWLELKLQGGKEELRARDLFFALFVPDLFMRRVEQDAEWTLMCPHECPGLDDVWGQEFEDLYTRYEREKRGQRTIRAQELWFAILRVQLETGTPYMLYKDSINAKSNQQNIGTIKQSNLCVAGDTEVLTEEGPVAIEKLANAHLDSKETIAKVKELEQELEAVKADAGNVTDVENSLAAYKAKLESIEKVELSEKDPIPVKVWNGAQWSEVTPTKTGNAVPLMRVTTSHGSVLDCTLQHKFILEDGSRVEAQELAIGSRIAPTPPVKYAGNPKYDIPHNHAFMRGFVYAYAAIKKGAEPGCLGPKPPTLKVPVLIVDKEKVTQETLDKLMYDEAASREAFEGQNHDVLAFIPVPEGSQAVQSRLRATEEVRKAWVSGYLTACCGNLDAVRASHALLSRVRTMFRSVGEDCRLSPAGRNGLWKLHWSENPDDAVPTVTAIQHLNAQEDTYCFTEPLAHAGVFNEQLTGQCSEIVEYTDANEIAVCNLASIALPRFVNLHDGDEGAGDGSFDFAELHSVTKQAVVNMNRIVDRNLYVLDKMKASNLRHRPIGIGVQGLADTFAMLRLPWEDEWAQANPAAKKLNQQIFETMYHAALEASCELAQASGPYETYEGSPVSKGVLQYDMWGVTPSDLWDWAALKAKIAEHGVRNSLLLTCMPTASTAQILGNNESIEPYTSNIYTRNVLSGEFQICNKYLVYELMAEGLWDEDMRQEIIAHSGSVQAIERIPKRIRDIFKTVWEISQKTLIDYSVDRGAFICQSQSFNLHMDPTAEMLSSAHFYGWEKGLKTGMYYLRSKPAADAIKFTIAPDVVQKAKAARDAAASAAATDTRTQEEIDEDAERLVCSRNNPGACTMCSA
jgi:ribonucleotide reductase alpha subunit